jgi:alkylation response protein AidB-like acyl-CoA dehydrogenase
LAEAIDRQGVYPKAELKQLAASGVFSAHLRAYGQPADVGLSILLIAEVARVCGSSGFMGWCQAACGVYLGLAELPRSIAPQLIPGAVSR